MRKRSIIVLQGVKRAVDQGKGSHQQAQPLLEVRLAGILSETSNRPVNVKCDKCIGYLITH